MGEGAWAKLRLVASFCLPCAAMLLTNKIRPPNVMATVKSCEQALARLLLNFLSQTVLNSMVIKQLYDLALCRIKRCFICLIYGLG